MAEHHQSETPPAGGMTAKPTAGHPVADNPLRMLHDQGWSTPRDLLKAAQKFKLLARHAPISRPEPCPQFCPRLRSAEDYAAAARRVSDPNDCAVALAFAPDNWQQPATPIGRALIAMLEAEHLPQGAERKAALLREAVQAWDSEAGEQWVDRALTTTRDQFNLQPDPQEVHRRSNQAVAKVAERAIADFGETIEEVEIDLLNTLEHCRRLPEVRGLIAGAEAVIARQWQPIQAYLDAAVRLQGDQAFFQRGEISEQRLDQLVKQCAECKNAYRLLQRRPALAQRLDPRVPHDVAALTVGIAFTLGLRRGRWQEAGVMIYGISPEDMLAGVNPRMGVQFQLALAATPLMVQAVRGEGLAELPGQLRELRLRYANCDGILDLLCDQVNWLRSGYSLEASLSAASARRQAAEAAPQRSGGAGLRGYGWFIAMLLFTVARLSNCERDSNTSSHNYSPRSYPPRDYERPSAVPRYPHPAPSPAGQPPLGLLTLLSTSAPAPVPTTTLSPSSPTAEPDATGSAPAAARPRRRFDVPRGVAPQLREERDAITNKLAFLRQWQQELMQEKLALDAERRRTDQTDIVANAPLDARAQRYEERLRAMQAMERDVRAQIASYTNKMEQYAR